MERSDNPSIPNQRKNNSKIISRTGWSGGVGCGISKEYFKR